MPKRNIDEKTGTDPSAKEKAKRIRDSESASSDYLDESEPKGLDEDLANPELEIANEDDGEDK
jgi:hypothetical protein